MGESSKFPKSWTFEIHILKLLYAYKLLIISSKMVNGPKMNWK